MNNDSNIVVKNLRKQENPVLVTAGEYRIALSVTRALGSLGIPVAVLSSEPDAMTFFSRYCTQKILTPPDHQKQEYISFLEELVKRQPFSGLIFCMIPLLNVDRAVKISVHFFSFCTDNKNPNQKEKQDELFQ